MHHSQSYPVTAVQVNLPQPHLSYSRSGNNPLCSGWCAFVCAGVFALVFLVCVYVLGGQRLFPAEVDPRADLVLTIKQGSLQVHPFRVWSDIGVESRYSSRLPPRNLSQLVSSMDNLFKAYPEKHEGRRHRNCWLENPGAEHPCFFDASWLGEVCTSDHSYGYEESQGHYSPCFVLRLEQTGDWRPRLTDRSPSDHYDPGFSPVHCHVRDPRGQQPNISIYPPKGFSHLFFPTSRFDPDTYLLPMVAVKLHGIPKGYGNFTLECSVVTPNAFFLWNNGKAVIRLEVA